MSRFRVFSLLVATVAMSAALAATAEAAPPSAQVLPMTTPPPEAPAATPELPVDFPIPQGWFPVSFGEQDGRYLALFRAEPPPASVRVLFGAVEVSADALVQEQVMRAMPEGFVSAGVTRSVDGRVVSTRLLRVHDDGSGVVDEAVVAARISPDDPGNGILFIAMRSGLRDPLLASQIQYAVLYTTFSAK